ILRAVHEQGKMEALWRSNPRSVEGPLASFSLDTLLRLEPRLARAHTAETRGLLARIRDGYGRLYDARLAHALASVRDRQSFAGLAERLSTSPELGVEFPHGLKPAQYRKLLDKHLPHWLDLAERFGTPPPSPRVAADMYRVIGKAALEQAAPDPLQRCRE